MDGEGRGREDGQPNDRDVDRIPESSGSQSSKALGASSAGLLGGPDLTSALARWVAEARVDEAARARARERWLSQQAAEETTFASVLVDLAERHRPVLVQTKLGRSHRGNITAVGVDFVGLATGTGDEVLISLDSITAVRSQPRDAAAHSGQAVALELFFHDALAAIAAERHRVSIATHPDGTVSGELSSLGRDVLTLRVDGDTRSHVYVPVHAVSEILVIAG